MGTSDLQFSDQSVTDTTLSVDKAIIPVVTALLGLGAAALPVILAVLNGLQNMAADSPWIVVFDQESQHASGAKFQIAAVGMDTNNDPAIALSCVSIDAARSVTQVLFFKLSDESVRMRVASDQLTTSGNLLEVSKDDIASCVTAFVSDFIKNIEI